MLKKVRRGYRGFVAFVLVLSMTAAGAGANAGMAFAAIESTAGSESITESSGPELQVQSDGSAFSESEGNSLPGTAGEELEEGESADSGEEQKESESADGGEEQKESESAEDGEEQEESESADGGEEQKESESAAGGEEQEESESAAGGEEQKESESAEGGEEQKESESAEDGEEQKESESAEGGEEQKESESAEGGEESEENERQKEAAGEAGEQKEEQQEEMEGQLKAVEQQPAVSPQMPAMKMGSQPQGNPGMEEEPPGIALTAVYEGLFDELIIDRVEQVSFNVMVELKQDKQQKQELISVDQISVEGEEEDGEIVYNVYYQLPEEYAGYAKGSVKADSGINLSYKDGVVFGKARNLEDEGIYDVTVVLEAQEIGYGVKHVHEGEEEGKALEETTQYGYIGEMTDAHPVEIEGYVVSEIRNEKLTSQGQIIIITYKLEDEALNSHYTVRYKDKATGNELASSETRIGLANMQVTVKAKGFKGYVADKISKSFTMQKGDNEIVFWYTKIDGLTYRVVYQYEDGSVIDERRGLPVLSSRFAVNADEKVLYDQSREGYRLAGASHQEFSPDPEKSGDAPENTVTFVFVLEEYRITYEGLEESGWSNPNPTVYTVEDEIRLANPEKEGYLFAGWVMENGTKVKIADESGHQEMETVIEKGTMGNLTFRATWKEIMKKDEKPSVKSSDHKEPEKENLPEGDNGKPDDGNPSEAGSGKSDSGNQAESSGRRTGGGIRSGGSSGRAGVNVSAESQPEEGQPGLGQAEESQADNVGGPLEASASYRQPRQENSEGRALQKESEADADNMKDAAGQNEKVPEAVRNQAGSGKREEVKEQEEKKSVIVRAENNGNHSSGQNALGGSHSIGRQGRSSGIRQFRLFRAIGVWLRGALLMFAASGALVLGYWKYRGYRRIFGRW